MDLAIVYTNHLGQTLELGAEGHLHYMETDLFDHAWSYEVVGKEAQTVLEARSFELPIGMFGGSLEERTRCHDVLAADAFAGKLGTISFHGWKLSCIPVAGALGAWWFSDGIEERAVEFVAPKPLWTKDVLLQFPAVAPSATAYEYLDHPYDHPFDFARPAPARTIDTGSAFPSSFKLVVYGPATNPALTIADNVHQVNVSVPAGSRLEVDTRDHTAVLIAQDGSVANVFAMRRRGSKGSGAYIWEPLPANPAEVTSSGPFCFDVIAHLERTEPRWDA